MTVIDREKAARLINLINNEGLPCSERIAAAARLSTLTRCVCMTLLKEQGTTGFPITRYTL